jgi:hypothetical protein
MKPKTSVPTLASSAAKESKMKNTLILTALLSSVFFAMTPASAKMMSCSGVDMSKMMTMIGGMADGPHKSEMYKHLAMINAAMAKDGTRGCEVTMMNIMSGSKMSRM